MKKRKKEAEYAYASTKSCELPFNSNGRMCIHIASLSDILTVFSTI